MRIVAAAALALAITIVSATTLFAQDVVTPAVTNEVETTTIDGGTGDATVVSAPADQAPDIVSDTTVVVPVGTWLDQVLAAVNSSLAIIITALVAWAFRALPKTVVDVLRTLQVEQLLTRAAEYGINATRGAVKGKTLNVDVGNEAVAKALQYAINNGPGWLINWMGGIEGIRDKLIARIPLDADVDAEDIRP